ncbi:hypothetical protein Bbelb_323390 [Branchiostoma belcheri]|nr:hypothetical protein Bbelb_323390 [Branchiostoma belcheri]
MYKYVSWSLDTPHNSPLNHRTHTVVLSVSSTGNVLRPLGEAMGMFLRTLLVLVIATAVIEDGARRNIRRERRGGGFGGGVHVAENSEGQIREVRDLRDAAELQGRGGASKIRGKRRASESDSSVY